MSAWMRSFSSFSLHDGLEKSPVTDYSTNTRNLLESKIPFVLGFFANSIFSKRGLALFFARIRINEKWTTVKISRKRKIPTIFRVFISPFCLFFLIWRERERKKKNKKKETESMVRWYKVRLDRCHQIYKNIVAASRVHAAITRSSKTIFLSSRIGSNSMEKSRRFSISFFFFFFLYPINRSQRDVLKMKLEIERKVCKAKVIRLVSN